MTLDDAAQVNVCVEAGAGWIDLFDPNGDKVEFNTSPDVSLGDQLRHALNHALTVNI
jgi:hypothetical protein